MENELFTFKDGRHVMEQSVSDRLYYIAGIHPERKQPDTTGYPWDESGMAELFSECYDKDTRYCPEAKSWYTYENGVWHKDVGELYISARVKEFKQIMMLYCGEIEDEAMQKDYTKFILKMGDRRFRDRLIKDARDVNPIPAAKFDANPHLINCKNGTYDLETMEFREHRWDDFLTMQTNFEYTVNGDVRCERWEQFIDEIMCGDKEKTDYLQRALGYSIIGSCKEECMFILYGKTTRNGKSTLLNAIEHLLGDYACVSPVAIICRTNGIKNADNASPTLAALKGKRFVTMAESGQYGKLDEEMIKQITGGEEITARNLHENLMSYLPQFTLWLSCNDLPIVQDKSIFASERLRVIEFDRHFKEDERDINLKETFKEPRNMQGIFSWLKDGYFKYKRFGLAMSERLKQPMRAYEKDNDVVQQFVEECCDTGGAFDTETAKDLYERYQKWCFAKGYKSLNMKNFNARLLQHPEWEIEKKESHGITKFYGIHITN